MFTPNALFGPSAFKDPQEVWAALCSSRIAIFARTKCLQTDEEGKWRTEIRADFRAGLRILLQYQGAGAHTWLLERRNGLSRDI